MRNSKKVSRTFRQLCRYNILTWLFLFFHRRGIGFPALAAGKPYRHFAILNPILFQHYRVIPFFAIVGLVDHLNTWHQTSVEDSTSASILVMRLAKDAIDAELYRGDR